MSSSSQMLKSLYKTIYIFRIQGATFKNKNITPGLKYGVYKIGMTKRSPEERKKEHSCKFVKFNCSVGPYLRQIEVYDPVSIESYIKIGLNDYVKKNPSRLLTREDLDSTEIYEGYEEDILKIIDKYTSEKFQNKAPLMMDMVYECPYCQTEINTGKEHYIQHVKKCWIDSRKKAGLSTTEKQKKDFTINFKEKYENLFPVKISAAEKRKRRSSSDKSPKKPQTPIGSDNDDPMDIDEGDGFNAAFKRMKMGGNKHDAYKKYLNKRTLEELQNNANNKKIKYTIKRNGKIVNVKKDTLILKLIKHKFGSE